LDLFRLLGGDPLGMMIEKARPNNNNVGSLALLSVHALEYTVTMNIQGFY